MVDSRTAPYGALILRVALGGLFIVHDAMKYFVFTPAGTAMFFSKLGLPGELAYVVMAAELIGGLALILGVWTRLAALALVPLMIGTIVTVHGANGFFFSSPNGGWEYPAFWALTLVIQALLGDGALALVPTPSSLTRRLPATGSNPA